MPDGASPLPDRLRYSAKAAGIEPGDPLAPFVETLAETVEGLRVVSPEAEADLARRVEAAVARGLPALGRHLDRRTWAVAACGAALFLALGGAAGWALRGETVVVSMEACAVSDRDGRPYVSCWIGQPAARR